MGSTPSTAVTHVPATATAPLHQGKVSPLHSTTSALLHRSINHPDTRSESNEEEGVTSSSLSPPHLPDSSLSFTSNFSQYGEGEEEAHLSAPLLPKRSSVAIIVLHCIPTVTTARHRKKHHHQHEFTSVLSDEERSTNAEIKAHRSLLPTADSDLHPMATCTPGGGTAAGSGGAVPRLLQQRRRRRSTPRGQIHFVLLSPNINTSDISSGGENGDQKGVFSFSDAFGDDAALSPPLPYIRRRRT